MVLNRKRSSTEITNNVELYPSELQAKAFDHQVGGHIKISRLDDLHILKPVNERECMFYKEMPDALLNVVPEFCGFIEGAYEDVSSVRSTCCAACSEHPIGRTTKGREDEMPQIKKRTDKTSYRIVLSDLTANFHCPCVLDLKMGTRQHGDSASEEKRRRQTAKCAASTSQKFGLRMCGMQCYDALSGETTHIDKYAGRSLSLSTLSHSLRIFLSYPDGSPRIAICQVLLNEIEEIQERILSMNGLRLYGSSLLIVYEGSSVREPVSLDEADSLIKIRVVDFANATFPGFMDDLAHSGADDGFVLGLHSLRGLVAQIMHITADSETSESDSDGSMSP